MKKILSAVLLVAFSATLSFGASLAATGAGTSTEAGRAVFPSSPNDDTVASTTAVGKTSTGVYVSWSMATGASKYATYAIKTQHQSGVRMYGTASDSTAITWATCTKGADNAAPTAADYSGVVGGTWTVM
ncbi:MAG: hypothetical protein Q7W05_14455 [Deltaproteobacteria bacterium]|nr:hypothetical protein [Deltaproteobacteria bacterium]